MGRDARDFAWIWVEGKGKLDERFAQDTYLTGSCFESFPVYPRKYIPEKGSIVFHVRLLKLGVLEMEGK